MVIDMNKEIFIIHGHVISRKHYLSTNRHEIDKIDKHISNNRLEILAVCAYTRV